jgi:hypothetical protein
VGLDSLTWLGIFAIHGCKFGNMDTQLNDSSQSLWWALCRARNPWPSPLCCLGAGCEDRSILWGGLEAMSTDKIFKVIRAYICHINIFCPKRIVYLVSLDCQSNGRPIAVWFREAHPKYVYQNMWGAYLCLCLGPAARVWPKIRSRNP